MDTIQSVLCLLIGSALPLAALFFLTRRGMRQFQVAHAYGEVSRQLGLDVDTRGLSLQGHLGDRRIWIGEVMVGHGPDRRMMTWGVLDLARPLGLGLMVRRRGRTTRLLRRAPGPDAPLGDADLDRVLETQGDDPGSVRQLFTPAVRQAVRTLMDVWPEVALTDRSVRVHLTRPEADVARLRLLVRCMLGVAEAVEEARQELPPPPALRQKQEAWQALATEHGLEFESSLPALSGTVGDHRVLVAPRRADDGYRVGLRLWFGVHTDTGLRLRRQTEPDGYWSVGQDIQVGATDFDARFVIKGWDPERIRSLLGPHVRQALIELDELGLTEVDDHGLYVDDMPVDAERAGRALLAAQRAAAALGW